MTDALRAKLRGALFNNSEAVEARPKDYSIHIDEKGINEAIAQIEQAFADAGYIAPENAKKIQEMVNQMANQANYMAQLPTIQYLVPNRAMTKAQNLMTGQEWYDRFERQYHMSADWISADEVMGDDAEHDVLNAAKKAAGVAS